MKRLILFVLFAIIITFSCSSNKTVFVISSEQQLLLPLKAANFFNFFGRMGEVVKIDCISSADDLIKFLNFSKYSVIITDRTTVQRVTELSDNWIVICKVGENHHDYFLLAKKSFVLEKDWFVKFVRGWNFGVDALKDPAVLKAINSGSEELRIKLHGCLD